MAHPAVVGGIIVGVALVLVLSFLPLTWLGVEDYNATITTTVSETCVLGVCSFQVQSIQPCDSGSATLLDWAAWFGLAHCTPMGSVGQSGPALNGCAVGCTYEVRVSMTGPGSFSASASETKLIGNVWSINVWDTIHFDFAYVPAGPYSVTSTLLVNGGTVASASGNICIGHC